MMCPRSLYWCQCCLAPSLMTWKVEECTPLASLQMIQNLGVAAMSSSCVAVQRLEKRVNGNVRQYSKGKCQYS